MSLARMLYRQLMRRAREHDRHPALKALLVNPQRQTVWQRLEARQKSGAGGGGSNPNPSLILVGPGAGSEFVESILRAAVQRAQKRLSSAGPEEEAPESKQSSKHTDDASGTDHDASSPSRSAAIDPATAALSRWLADFFRGRDYYLPLPTLVSMESMVRREFRLPLPPPTPPPLPTAAPAATTSKRPSSAASSSSHSPSPLQHLTNKAFEILRTLNRNHAEGSKRHLLMREEDVMIDPAFLPAIAPRPPPSLSSPQLHPNDPSADSVTDASSLPEGFRMKPTTQLRAGTFLVAHPQLDESTFGRTVILLTRTATSSTDELDRHSGSAGFVINAPFRLLNTLGDKLPKRLKVSDPLRLLKGCALQDGGPVMSPLLANLSSTSSSSSSSSASGSGNSGHLSFGLGRSPPGLLHRLPLLASISTPIITHATFPVWMLEANMLEQAATMIEQEINAATAAASSAHSASAAANSPSSPAAESSSSASVAGSPASPVASSVFLPSDLVAYSGCAEWAPGQLEDEIARGSWMVVEGSGAHVFASPATEAEAAVAASDSNGGADNDDKGIAASAKKAVARRKKKPVDSSKLDGAASLPTSAVQLSPLPHRPARPFLQSRVWSHAMHVHGGESRHWAHMPNPNEATSDSNAIITELLAGRRH